MCFGGGGGGGSPPPPDPHYDAFLDTLSSISQDQYAFAKENYRPIELQLIKDAERYRSPEYASEQAARAEGDVTRQYENQRRALALDPLTSNPNNPQYMATRRALGIAQAGQTAAAGTTARTNAGLTGFNIEAGLAGKGDAKVNQSIGAASAGGQIANQKYGIDSNNWQYGQQQQAGGLAGLGNLLGTVGGMFLMSSKKFKHSIKAFKNGLAAVDAMPVKRWRYKDGVADGGEHEHIGPMAEDHHSATGVGTDDVIHLGDTVGTTLAAIQELHKRVQTLEAKRPKGRVIEGESSREAA